MSKGIAVYPGSFDPMHNGHLDIVEKCRRVFDEVIVAVLGNESKEPVFSLADRVEMIEHQLRDCPECQVARFDGLLVDFMEQSGAQIIIRGLRAVSDFEYEFQMALMNRRLSPHIDTVFMVPKGEYIYLSSRLVKEVFFLGGNLVGLVPDPILEKLGEVAASRAKDSS